MPNYVHFTKRDWPTSERGEWDAEAAGQRLLDHFGWKDGSHPVAEGGDTKSAFLLAEADSLRSHSAYRWPLTDVIDGKVTVTRGALRSAANHLGHATDVSDAERKRARQTIDHYYAQLNEPGEDDDQRGLMIATMPIGAGRIVQPQRAVELEEDGSVRAAGSRTTGPALPDKLLEQVHDREALSETPLYLFPATASSSLPDTFGTRMLKSSLTNFAGAAQRGLPLVNSHRKDMLPLGRIYDGRVSTRDGVTHATFEQYLPMGDYEVAGIRTASVVQGIRLGINRDTSIGFYSGRIMCSICKRSMPTSIFDLLFGDEESMCVEHMPLGEYDERGADNKPTGSRVTCYGDVDGAQCGEMSLVFKGATPEAQVISGKRTMLTFEEAHTPVLVRAVALDQLGRLDRSAASALDERFNLSGRGYRFDALHQRYSLAAMREHNRSDDPPAPAQASEPDPTPPEESAMPPDPVATPTPAPAVETAAPAPDPPAGGGSSALASTPSGSPPAAGTIEVGTLRALLVEVRAVDDGFTGDPIAHIRRFYTTELPALRARADLGEQAMSNLRDEVKAEGVRAYGKDRYPEFYNGIIDGADMPTLRDLKEHFRTQAAERLQPGRATTESGDGGTPAPAAQADDYPDYVFSAR